MPDRAIKSVKGIGNARACLLSGLGINTVIDAVTYFPRDYEDRSEKKKLHELSDGDQCSFEGVLASEISEYSPRKGLLISRAVIKDETGSIDVVWFNNKYLKKNLVRGERYVFYGKISRRILAEVQNPVFEKAGLEQPFKTSRIVPVYRATAGITQNILRSTIRNALDQAAGEIDDCLPQWLRKEYNLHDAAFCYENIHFPSSNEAFLTARYRLVFEELLLLQLKLFMLNRTRSSEKKGISFSSDQKTISFVQSLPFKFTCAQKKVLEEIERDMESDKPMNRLIQGDVGSGKTAVAAAALFKAVKSGWQGAMMVPTGILAKQHYDAFITMFEKFGIRIALLTGNMAQRVKSDLLAKLQDASVDIVIGTHALIEEKVLFDKLGLVVTDEQHRFGVKQRAALISKGGEPDTLVMSATPIPRTLALILYGDLDISTIDEMPPGRKPAKTYVVDESIRPRINAFIRKQISLGRQAFIICPLVEESELIDAKSAVEHAEDLALREFKDLSVGLIHGRMSANDKDKVMEGFAGGSVSILVSTTVVEVGVNIPNATLMVVENAERFGLAQLHQLRGRIGRGAEQSYCVLYNASRSEHSAKRLEVMQETADGFVISEKDLELRGPGDFFGTRQHGIPELKIANLYRDIEVLKLAQSAAKELFDSGRLFEKDSERLFEKTAAGIQAV